MMNNEPVETCMFFVDDSNIWIEAQKFAASGNQYMPKLEDSDVDPRLRIDIGRLVDTLRRTRKQGPSFLYGSRPPPNDSVWNEFRNKFKFRTKIYNRNSRNKEKEVDNSLATDLVSEGAELRIRAEYDPMLKQKKESTVFIVITGDRDMLPPIKKVLDSDIRVELWGWRNGIAKEYYNEQTNRNGLLSIYHLDTRFNEIFFTNFKSTRKGSKAQVVDPARTMVLCGFDEQDAEDLDEDSIGKELIRFRYLFYISPSTSRAEIFVEFPNVDDIEFMILKSRKYFNGRLTVVSWPEYAQRFNLGASEVVEEKNMYKPLTDEHGQPPSLDPERSEREAVTGKVEPSGNVYFQAEYGVNKNMQGPNEPNNDEGWQTVTRSEPAKDHRRALRQAQQCREGVRCFKRGECGYQHSKKERDLFQDNPNQDFRLWKTKRCKQASCHYGDKCRFAHPKDEGWCLFCKHWGHCTDECKYG